MCAGKIKARKAFFALLAFMRDSEGVAKPQPESRSSAGGRRSAARSGLEAEAFSTSAETLKKDFGLPYFVNVPQQSACLLYAYLEFIY